MGQRVDGELLSYCCKCEVLRVASTAGCPPSLAYAMSRTIMCAHRIMYVNVFSIPSKWLGSRLEYGAFCSAGKGFVPSSVSVFSTEKVVRASSSWRKVGSASSLYVRCVSDD